MEEQLLFINAKEFRQWLEVNASSSKGAWLIFGKTAAVRTLKAEDALKEALCFGWIDGQIKSVDETKYIKKFTPRRKGSNWSEKNKGLTAKLIEQGFMTKLGFNAIEQAKMDGSWDTPKTEPISDEQINLLVEALKNFEPAITNFQNMSRSVRVTYTAHFLDAKTEATRNKRLMQIVERLNENKKPM